MANNALEETRGLTSNETHINTIGKWELLRKNTEIVIAEKEVADVLSCIDNVMYFREFDLSSINATNFFFLCVNTHKNIDDPYADDRMLNVKDEILAITNWFHKYNIRNLVLINTTRDIFLAILERFHPIKLHYTGHSTNIGILFRKKQFVTSSDLRIKYSSIPIEYIFLNSCNSSAIANAIFPECTHQSIGYMYGLNNRLAVEFASEMYRLLTPFSMRHVRPIFEQAVANVSPEYQNAVLGYSING